MRILFQGDSITDAGRDKGNNNCLGKGYANLVGAELSYFNAGQHTYINKGISGNRVVDLYARIKSDIINLKPNVLSILIGVNDVWHEFEESPNGVDADKFFEIYSKIVEEIKSELPNIAIMIMEPFALKGSGNEDYWDIFKLEVEKRARKAYEISKKYDLIFIPLQEMFDKVSSQTSNDCWVLDGVHPTLAGHELIKRSWLKAFNNLK